MLLIQFYGWTGFDPIASLFIAILITVSVILLVIDTGKILCLDIDHPIETKTFGEHYWRYVFGPSPMSTTQLTAYFSLCLSKD